MIKLYRLTGALYFFSGFWCIFELEKVIQFLGFIVVSDMGKSEFFSVYGGLQIGLGMSILLSSFRTEYVEASIYFSAIFSTFLACFRMVSFVIYGISENFIYMFVLELFIGVALWTIWINFKKHDQ